MITTSKNHDYILDFRREVLIPDSVGKKNSFSQHTQSISEKKKTSTGCLLRNPKRLLLVYKSLACVGNLLFVLVTSF
jgi:hypothetical protein